MTLGLLGVEIGKSSAWANGRSVVALENVVSIGKFVLPHESGNVQAQVELASAHDSISAFRGLNAAAAVVDVSTDLRSAVVSAETANKAVSVFMRYPFITGHCINTGS